MRVQAVGLGRDRDRIHAGRCLGAARRVAEQEVLAADDERLDTALGQVVVERQSAVDAASPDAAQKLES